MTTQRRSYAASLHKPLVVIAGCTGTGKSDMGVAIAEAYGGEVISADSIQIYQGLDIASNKLGQDEMRNIPHHMMGFLHPALDYQIHQFRNAALKLLDEIWARNRLPVLVGGTTYYVESVIFSDYLIDIGSGEDTERIRERYEQGELTNEQLVEMLVKVDPESAAQISPKSGSKLMRALEIYYTSGRKKSEILEERMLNDHQGSEKLRFPNTLLLNLDAPREILKERIERRVEKMLEKGLLQEVEDFYVQHGDAVGSFGIAQSIGLKEFLPYLRLLDEEKKGKKGQKLLADAVQLLKSRTHRLSQHQRKWHSNRFLRRVARGQLANFLTLNTASDFEGELLPFVLNDLMLKFLSGSGVPPQSSPLWDDQPLVIRLSLREELMDQNYAKEANTLYHCATCDVDIRSKYVYEQHMRSKNHKWKISFKKHKDEWAAAAAAQLERPNSEVELQDSSKDVEVEK